MKKGKKILRVVRKILTLILLLVLVAGVICFNRIRTACSLRNIGGDLYYAEYYNDYHLKDAMTEGAGSVAEMAKFVSKNILFGYPVDLSEDSYACSAFIAVNEKGEHLVGRNFDYPESPAIILHCNPEDGYESYGMLPAYLLDLGTEEALTSLFGRACVLAMPYSVVDGINEAGLCVVVLELEGDMTAQDSGRPDVMTTFAVRILLDRCATVEEAVNMLGQFDMHSAVGAPYHLFIADRSGSSVVVEWPEDELSVVEASHVTNFWMTEGANEIYGDSFGHERYDIAEAALQASGGKLSADKAMELLSDVVSIWGVEGEYETEYSVVYNLDRFTTEVCNDMDYASRYSFG